VWGVRLLCWGLLLGCVGELGRIGYSWGALSRPTWDNISSLIFVATIMALAIMVLRLNVESQTTDQGFQASPRADAAGFLRGLFKWAFLILVLCQIPLVVYTGWRHIQGSGMEIIYIVVMSAVLLQCAYRACQDLVVKKKEKPPKVASEAK